MRVRDSAGSILHWWLQRISAALMIPFLFWFVCLFFASAISSGVSSFFSSLLFEPIQLACFMFFFLIAFYHALLGIQVICQDYISCATMRIATIWLLRVLGVVTIFLFICSVLFSYSPIQ